MCEIDSAASVGKKRECVGDKNDHVKRRGKKNKNDFSEPWIRKTRQAAPKKQRTERRGGQQPAPAFQNAGSDTCEAGRGIQLNKHRDVSPTTQNERPHSSRPKKTKIQPGGVPKEGRLKNKGW